MLFKVTYYKVKKAQLRFINQVYERKSTNICIPVRQSFLYPYLNPVVLQAPFYNHHVHLGNM